MKKLLLTSLAISALVTIVSSITHTSTFAQRYGANSYITNHPLYMKSNTHTKDCSHNN
jgi:uncharacterized protein YxeA